MIVVCRDGGDFKPHPEGIYPAVCVDVMNLGLMESDFNGVRKLQPKCKVVFETEALTDKGVRCTVSKSMTVSLHPKAKLAEFIGKWRGRPVAINEAIDLQKLIGASCTLVISHSQNMVGKTYAGIDAVSKPTKKLVPSGQYDPAAARQRFAEWRAKQASPAPLAPATMAAPRPVTAAPAPFVPVVPTPFPPQPPAAPVSPIEEDDVPF